MFESHLSCCYSAEFADQCEQVIVSRDNRKPLLVNFTDLGELRLYLHRAGFTADETSMVVGDVKDCRRALAERA